MSMPFISILIRILDVCVCNCVFVFVPELLFHLWNAVAFHIADEKKNMKNDQMAAMNT